MTEQQGLVPYDDNLPSSTILEEIKRVSAICATAQAVMQTLEAQLMESFWKIRQELGGDQARFQMLIRTYTQFQSDRAWLMADTWEAARKNRQLRTLATREPSEALRLVSRFVDAGITEQLESLSEDEQQTARFLTLSPRKQAAQIREWKDDAKAAREGHNPGDLERIRAAEAERDAAIEELDRERQLKLGGKSPVREALNALRDAEKRLAQAREALKAVLDQASHETRDEMMYISDLAMTTIERLHAEIYEAHERAAKIEIVE